MSYILDALRKSDEQRLRGATPTLLTPQASSVTPARSRTFLYGLLAAVLICTGIVIGALRPWQSAPRVPEAIGTLEAPVGRPAPAPEPAPVAQSVPPIATPATPATASAKSEVRVRAPEPRREAAATVPRKTARAEGAKTDGGHVAGAAQEQRVVAFGDLPVAVQEEIPRLSISAHAYSPVARDRLVGINDRVLREGSEVAPGLTLEQITPEGMIMTYKGYRFRRGAR